jgi:NO-binding membrane sensor protein with MHYT domain|tara:strand:+ start:419 stop:658 length:240 start_codon:yes stop_codon:yes gene_type:complete
MKTILTLIFVLFIGMAAQAQNGAAEVKVETVTMSIVAATAKQDVAVKNENSVARLYMFKNSKIIKELSFSTKLNKAKLA